MFRGLGIVVCLFFISGCATYLTQRLDSLYGEENPENRTSVADAAQIRFYNERVRPILDHRCVSCHACYDAPCQLKLTAAEGIERGGSKDLVYDGTRLLAASPTRLFIDAHSTKAWREKGFHPVLNERDQSPTANLQASLLYRAISLRGEQGEFTQTVLSNDYDFSLSRNQQCPSIEEYDAFEQNYPKWGMPYGLPSLTKAEHNTLTRWLATGGKMPPVDALSNQEKQWVTLWESRLNSDNLKGQLVSRYIYEHIYLYSLYLDGSDRRFKLVRSKTPPGQPIERINTRRPYDPPGVDHVYYRLWLDPEVTVQKTNIPLKLDEARYALWYSYFYSADYQVTRDPGYDVEVATNPFRAFQELPEYGRYRFLLEHAQNTIMSFIKGPVCRGQIAVNVINDHFWVYFVDPDISYNKVTSEFLESQVQYLNMPAEDTSNALPLTSWVGFSDLQKSYLSAKVALIKQLINTGALPLDLSLVWDGDGVNDNAALTVFRHFDNASVVKGLVGQQPKTAWLIDYPLLERIHYLLVAGFDVFGNIGHQLVTRLYMDFLRMEGEMNFLQLLPKEDRESIRQYWYRDANQMIKDYIFSDYINLNSQSQVTYTTENHQSELYTKLRKHLKTVLNHDYDIERSQLSQSSIQQLKQLQAQQNSGFQYLPEVSLLLVTDHGVPNEVISLIHNRGHANISSLLDEESTLRPQEDTVTLVKGVLGDYPNVFMRVEKSQLQSWAKQVSQLATSQDYVELLNRFGVRRTSPDFWQVSDAVASLNKLNRPKESGILDYNRLENR